MNGLSPITVPENLLRTGEASQEGFSDPVTIVALVAIGATLVSSVIPCARRAWASLYPQQGEERATNQPESQPPGGLGENGEARQSELDEGLVAAVEGHDREKQIYAFLKAGANPNIEVMKEPALVYCLNWAWARKYCEYFAEDSRTNVNIDYFGKNLYILL